MGQFMPLKGSGGVDPAACAVFLILAFILAGVAQTIWLRSPFSRHFQTPLDLGKTFRGKRILGANKTLRGFVVMIPAVGGSFFLLASIFSHYPKLRGLPWSESPSVYALFGLAAGLGFMAGELPNSFLKRRFGILPGEAPSRRSARIVCFVVDRIDSIVGMLLVLGLVASIPWLTWLYLALLGPPVHWLFSVALYWLGVKRRPA